jgi:uroporphyrin-III C-methyltransferase
MPTARARPGWVHIVGAGPGDPGLLTVKARDLVESCNCLLFDQLAATNGILDLAPPSCETIDVGKVGYGCQAQQTEIQDTLVDRARKGRRVVRLKGGCPTVYGRLSEEVEALRAAGVPHEVVPGVSSALAVPACAGIAVTRRGLASSVAIVTGHPSAPGRRPLAAVAHADTVVVLMGARRVASLAAELMAHGRSPETPAAFVSEGTGPRQRTLRATLGTLAEAVRQAKLGAPAVVVVGEVASAAHAVSTDAALQDHVTDILVASRI